MSADSIGSENDRAENGFVAAPVKVNRNRAKELEDAYIEYLIRALGRGFGKLSDATLQDVRKYVNDPTFF